MCERGNEIQNGMNGILDHLKAMLGRGQPRLMGWLFYESCPRCRWNEIKGITRWHKTQVNWSYSCSSKYHFYVRTVGNSLTAKKSHCRAVQRWYFVKSSRLNISTCWSAAQRAIIVLRPSISNRWKKYTSLKYRTTNICDMCFINIFLNQYHTLGILLFLSVQ